MSGPSFAEIVEETTPCVRTVRICTRGDLVARLRALREELADARRLDAGENRVPEAPEVARAIVDVEAEARGYEREFVLQGIGRVAFRDLVVAHPPSEVMQERARASGAGQLEWDPDSFYPALVAASCTTPKGVTVDTLAKWLPKIGFAQWQALWAAALEASAGDVSVPTYAAAYAILGLSDRSLPSSATTPARGESPAPSS